VHHGLNSPEYAEKLVHVVTISGEVMLDVVEHILNVLERFRAHTKAALGLLLLHDAFLTELVSIS
jgi:hypothetical protein